jgi:transcriptional regulator GlxA family with amidase domain
LLLDVVGPAEVFSEANRYGAHYEVVTYSRDGYPVRSSTGIQLAVDAAADTATSLDTVLLPESEALAVLPIEPQLVAAAGQLLRGALVSPSRPLCGLPQRGGRGELTLSAVRNAAAVS